MDFEPLGQGQISRRFHECICQKCGHRFKSNIPCNQIRCPKCGNYIQAEVGPAKG